MDRETAQKVIDLETTLGLLQRDFEKQNEMILLDARRLDRLEREVRELRDRVEMVRAAADSEPIPDERPPHY